MRKNIYIWIFLFCLGCTNNSSNGNLGGSSSQSSSQKEDKTPLIQKSKAHIKEEAAGAKKKEAIFKEFAGQSKKMDENVANFLEYNLQTQTIKNYFRENRRYQQILERPRNIYSFVLPVEAAFDEKTEKIAEMFIHTGMVNQYLLNHCLISSKNLNNLWQGETKTVGGKALKINPTSKKMTIGTEEANIVELIELKDGTIVILIDRVFI